MKYKTKAGIECTPEECKLIDSLKRVAKKWAKDGKRLWLYSASGTLHVMMRGDREDNPTPEMTLSGGGNYDNSITIINGISNDGRDWQMDQACLWQHRLHGENKKSFEEGACWMKNLAVKAIFGILERNFRDELRNQDVMHIVSLLEIELTEKFEDYKC